MARAVCAWCGKRFDIHVGHLNRSKKVGLKLYCSRKHSGLGRRTNRSTKEKKEAKRLYDLNYRAANLAMLKAKKAEYHKLTYDPVAAAKVRKKRMKYHVAYCQQDEYRAWKKGYDRQYRCKQEFGPYWEAASLLLDVENEIDSRITRYEIYQQNGTLNKNLTRRREYEKLIRN